MQRRNTITLLIILVIFGFSIYSIFNPVFGRKNLPLGLDLRGGIRLVYQADLSAVPPDEQAAAIESSIAVIERRVNILGVSEPNIQKLGEDSILVELPGIGEIDRAKTLIGQTALIEFGEAVAEGEEANWTDELGKWKPATATIDGKQLELTSAYFKENTYVDTDQYGRLYLFFEWNEEGTKLSTEITGRMVGKQLAIFLGDEPLRGEDGKPIAPIVQSQITDRGQIEGLSLNDATELSRLLNAGRIPVPLTSVFQQNIDPILGERFVDLSLKAGIVGIALVMLFMILYYRLPGFLASLALAFYTALVVALFKLIPVTLTLAGIGGFIVSVGMAVDANVLIFERMKEELQLGKTLGAAVEAGFNRAWLAIRDSNITTFIACAVLYWVGSAVISGGQVKGFAVTLFIGVAVSMFTAITVTPTFLRATLSTPAANKTSLFTPYEVKKND